MSDFNPDNWKRVDFSQGIVKDVYFGMSSLSMFMDEMGEDDLNKIQYLLKKPKGILKLIYCLCYVGDRIRNNEIDYNEFTVGMWVDAMTQEELNALMSQFEKANLMGKKAGKGKTQATPQKKK